MAASMADLGFNIDSSPMRRATGELDKMSTASGRAEKSAQRLVSAKAAVRKTAIAATAAIAGLTATLAVYTRQGLNNVDAQAKLARSLDATADGVRAVQLAASDSGIDGMEMSLNRLNRRLGAAAMGQGEYAKSVEALGLSVRDLQAMDADERVAAIADAVQSSGMASQEAARHLQQLGFEQANANAFFRQGGDAIRGARKEIVDYGLSLSEVDSAKVEMANDAMARISLSTEAATNRLAIEMAPAIKAVSELLTDAAKEGGGMGDAIAEGVQFGVEAAAFLADTVDGVRRVFLLAGQGVALFALGVQDAMSTAAEFIVGGPIRAINNLIDLMNELPGVAIRTIERPQFVQQMQQSMREARLAQQVALEDMRETLMAPLPSVGILKAYEDAKEETQRLAEESARLGEEMRAAATGMTQAETAANDLAGVYDALIGKLDPAQAALNEYFETMEAIDSLDVSGREKDRLREAAFEQHWKRMADIAVDGGEDSAEEFVNPWQSAADRVADGLQNAIASGDWDKLGDAIGNTLAASISSIVNKTITDALAQDLTANSGMFASIAGAFAGPIAGAVAGGVVQMAVAEVSDWMSGSDWDPTEARQASQGTGTVLGSIDAKSESIAKATDRAATASRELVGINRDMLRALQVLQLGITGASGMISRSYGGLEFSTQNRFTAEEQAAQGLSVALGGITSGSFGGLLSFGGILDEVTGVFAGAFGEVAGFLDGITGGLLSDIGSSVFGGKTDVKDVGIEFFGATIEEMIRGWRDGDRFLTAQAYASIKQDGGWFSSDKRWDEYQLLGTDAENQISMVFMGIRDSVTAGAKAIGMSGSEIQSALDTFRVESQKISLEDLNAEQQAAELEAVFSSIFDQAAGAVVPYLKDFQMAGEGLGETLARVATNVAVTEQAVDMLGLRFSSLSGRALVEATQRLVEVNGGMEQFISGMQNFISNFATEAQQFEINANALASGMGNLPLPETREGFWQLLQAQDAATAAGAENIATLLRLQGTANEYYSAVEKAQKSYYETEIQGQRDRLNEAVKAQSAVESALGRMVLDSRSVQQASRANALEALQRAASSGRVTAGDALDRNLSAATAMQASDYATFGDYIQDYARTTSTLLDLKEITDRQVTTEERMLSSLERQLEAVTGLRADLERSQLAIIKQTNKSAKTLERIEIDGLEVRA